MIKNLDKINAIKREKIFNGLKFVEKYNDKEVFIDKIIIFGSSVRDDCTEDSDIDLCFMSKYTVKYKELMGFYRGLPDELDDLCDIIPFNECDSSFQSKVLKKGVVVYGYSES